MNQNNLVLDLRFSGQLSAKVIPDFNDLAMKLRPEFHAMLEVVSAENRDNLDWWFSAPASRNTFSSPLFHYFCCLYVWR